MILIFPNVLGTFVRTHRYRVVPESLHILWHLSTMFQPLCDSVSLRDKERLRSPPTWHSTAMRVEGP